MLINVFLLILYTFSQVKDYVSSTLQLGTSFSDGLLTKHQGKLQHFETVVSLKLLLQILI